MATVTVTVGDVFLAAIQAEAAIDGVGAQAWAKGVIKAEVKRRRLEREEAAQEEIRKVATAQSVAQIAAVKATALTNLTAQMDALT